MTSWMRNQLTKLCNAVSAPVTATRDALVERLQSIRDTASLLYNRMVGNMRYGQQEFHLHWNMSLTILKHKTCARRQYVTSHA